jgi:hypothetical protein
VQKICQTEPNSAVIYWYFTFADAEKQKRANMVGSLIADICSNRRDTPSTLQLAYDQANYGQQQPTFKTLMVMLKEVILGFENIFLVVDALDECPRHDAEREAVLNVLHEVHSWNMSSMHVLATSRREIDIQDSFDNILEQSNHAQSLSLEGQIADDIKKYIQHRLGHRIFQKWRPELKQDVERQLSAKADSMCVLNILY